jgi:hypothetical protein
MTDRDPLADRNALRRSALSRWDDEGGATAPAAQQTPLEIPDLGNAELVQLRIRVIALENLLIAVLAQGSDRQLQVARDMAEYIAPRPGVTKHPLTIRAADHMTDMVKRALHFRTVEPT